MLLIGSKALNFFGRKYLSPDIKQRRNDTDIICTYDEFLYCKNQIIGKYNIVSDTPHNKGKNIITRTKNKDIYEFELAWPNSTGSELIKIVKDNNLYENFNDFYVANPEVIFTLKKTHRYLKNSPHFMKTMLDYRHLRDKCGLDVPACLIEWYKRREKETYSYSHPKLNVSKNEFFKGDGVPYIYDHDSIHEAMKHFDKPAYEYYKVEGEEVKCAKDLFYACSEQIRLYGVLEEAYVLALERSQIPAPNVWTPYKSFEYALMKVCTSITSGFFRAYAYENYFKVLDMYNDKYVQKFWAAVEKGIVKKIAKNDSSNISQISSTSMVLVST